MVTNEVDDGLALHIQEGGKLPKKPAAPDSGMPEEPEQWEKFLLHGQKEPSSLLRQAVEYANRLRAYALALHEKREPDTATKTLMRFYSASTLEELVLAQAHHIEKLQAKLPPLADREIGRVREG
jgi:hypothetical protein